MNNEETIIQNENMMDDERTLLQNDNNEGVAEGAADNKKKGDAWKYAAGAIPGMVVGAGAVLAADAMASDATPTNPSVPATEGDLKPESYTDDEELAATGTEADAETATETAAAVEAQSEQGGAEVELATPEEIAYAEEHNGALPYEGEEAAAAATTTTAASEDADVNAFATVTTDANATATVTASAANVNVEVDGTDVKVVTPDGVNVNIHINTDSEAEANNTVEEEVIGSGVSAPSVADVTDDMSFSEAFAAARDQVGAGGVFHWRGGIYGTYYADEWSKMSADEKSQFVEEARLEMKAGEGDPNHYLANHTSDENYGGDIADNDDTDDDIIDDDIHETSFTGGDEDIRIIGLDTIEVSDGHDITLGAMNVGGTDVAFVDADGDGSFDFMVADLNDNGEIDAGEVTGITDDDATVDNFLALAEANDVLADLDLDDIADIPTEETFDL